MGQWHTHRCFRPPMSARLSHKIGAHLGRLGLPYLTLCPYDPIATSLPSRSLCSRAGSDEPPWHTSRHSDYNSLTLSLGQYRGADGSGWVGVLLLGGGRVSVYCVEGHRFNLIMPEGPCATPTKLYTLHIRHIPPQLRSKTVEEQTISSTRDKIDWVSRFTKGWL